MMRYTITFTEDDYASLVSHLFADTTIERAAYALCRISSSRLETRLLVQEVIPVEHNDVIEATPISMKIKNISFLRAMKRAHLNKQVFVFIHSHPNDFPNHSQQDDREELSLFKTAYQRIKTNGVHGSIVISSASKPVGRIWLGDATYIPISLIRVIGKRFKFYTDVELDPLPVFFDRQIRAFGSEIQKVLKILNIGIIGQGGTGSAVREQLTRLGVGKITVIDGQKFDSTNVNRVYGSSANDQGVDKVEIAKRAIEFVNLKTDVASFSKNITFSSVAEKMKDCDIIFGCTDDQWGRSIMNRLSIYYQIPVFDLGVLIESENGIIKSIRGRVTTLLFENACLVCRDRINARGIENERLTELEPERHKALVKQGYADELNEPAPAVIPFVTAVASAAITELMHRLTGYMGKERESNEVILLLDETRIRTNFQKSKPGCICSDKYFLNRGDCKPFLDLTWRQE